VNNQTPKRPSVALVAAHALSFALLLGTLFVLWINRAPNVVGKSPRSECELTVSAATDAARPILDLCKFFESQYLAAINVIDLSTIYAAATLSFLAVLQAIQLVLVFVRPGK
jgi:hypothetical protein